MRHDSNDHAIGRAGNTKNYTRTNLCCETEVDKPDLGAGLSPLSLTSIVFLKDQIGYANKLLI